ncbi:MAG TPA: packaged DNA stabilization protein, partial [Aquirhabdus sp.]
MNIPILSGIYTTMAGDFKSVYPMNLVPVPKQSGVSDSYLKTADGIIRLGTDSLSGIDRGGINWKGILYRVIGASLIRVDDGGEITVLGNVGSGGRCSFDYGFDKLSIQSGTSLYYYDGSNLTAVTDVDLGSVLDQIWVDGYFMTTDGTSLVVTELNDPTQVNPLKYGSSESDPDKVVGLLKVRGEVLALNRYTIEKFQNVGGANFPFQRISGALIQKGCVGKDAKCRVGQTYAFVGNGRNEAVSIWLGNNSNAVKIATREIEQILSKYSESQLSTTVMEAREFDAHQHIYVHLPNE